MTIQRNMKKITGLLLLIGVLSLTSCGSAGSARKGTSASTVQLTPEEQRKYEYYFLEAIRLKEKQEYDAAFGLFQHCLSIHPQASSALYEIAQYYFFLKQIPQGQAALEKAVENDPENYWYSQALASLYQQQDQTEKAIALFENMSVHFPGKQEPLFALAEIYSKQEQYAKMISVLDRLEDRVGKNEQFTMEKFRIYNQMKDPKNAFREIESLVKEYPMDMRYQVVLGDAYLDDGRKQEAYDIYRKVLDYEPDNVQALFSLASYYDQTGQKELYEQQLDTLLLNKKVPSDAKVEVMRQFILQNEQAGADSTQVITMFDRMMSQDPDDENIPMMYAQYLLVKGMEKESIPVLKQVVRIDPTNKAARMTLLGSAIRKEDYQQVIDLCEAGIEATPDALEFYFYLSMAYNQADRTDDIITICKKALTQVTSESKKEMVSDLYSILGDTYHTKKQMEEAFAAYDSALVYNPSNVGALNNYAYYLSVARRNLDKAEEMSHKTVKAEPNNSTFLDTYAWILFEKGNYAEARIYIDDAIKNGGDKSDVVVEHCGDIYYMNGDVEGALKYWKQAKEMGNDSATLKKKIEKKKYIAE